MGLTYLASQQLIRIFTFPMNFIQETCNQIVVPTKLKYSQMDLGYAIINHGRRFDFEVRNNDKQILKSSLYVPKQPHSSRICVIYLHSMNGSRLQCLSYVQTILQKGYYLCSFDFSGCGNSEGTCISFGANQKYDIAAVIQQLMGSYSLNRFILWGRSMGAVTCIKYCQMLMNNYSVVEIHGIILDSPFESLKSLIIQLGAKRSDLPKLFVKGFYYVIKSTLQKKGNFDVDDLELIRSIKKIEGTSILFLVSKDDTTIDSSHSQNLYSAYQYWDKKLKYFSGLHNESRDEQYINNVIFFIDEKANRAQENKINIRYKRLLLQQSLIRRNMTEQTQNKGECECNIFRNHYK